MSGIYIPISSSRKQFEGDDPKLVERQGILTRLLDAVKQCQVRFGGRSELATDADSRISCLVVTWEVALQHGLKKNNKALSALRHVTERAGLGKMSDFFSEVKNLDTDPAFWHYVREHLTRHEVQRFNMLKQVNTDIGRGRAWLRACLNEHSLERYMHMLIEKEDFINQYYYDWAFMCDQERNSMLPTMAAGLGSILFAVTVDRPELNKPYQNQVYVGSGGDVTISGTADDEPRPVIAEEASPPTKKKEKKKKKKIANVVSFDEDDTTSNPQRQGSVTSAASSGAGEELLGDNSENPLEHIDNGSISLESVESPNTSGKSNSDQAFDDFVNTSCAVLKRISSKASNSSGGSADFFAKSRNGSASSAECDTSGSAITPVGLLHDDSDMIPVSRNSLSEDNIHSDNSSYISVFSQHEVDNAALALAMIQKGLESARTEGDGSIAQQRPEHHSMNPDDLKQAVVSMMIRKDEVEERNRSLQALIEQEMDTSSILRADIAELKRAHQMREDASQAKITKLQSENELLKHQLKKYVSAVQMLRTEGANKEVDSLGIKVDDLQPSIPPPKSLIDYSQEAIEYEQKLIQVAEMHGELMEFNEMLHRHLNAKEAILRKLRDELITLRGPLPYHDQQFEESISTNIDSLSVQSRSLINIWIPSAYLRGSSTEKYHVYQVYIRIRDEEWNVFRRFSQFLDLHTRLKKIYPIVGKFGFPPKKTVGNKDARIVELRRLAFQHYLRNVINLILDKNPDLGVNTCKIKLISLLPFFGDQPEPVGKKGKRVQQPLLPTSPVSSSLPTNHNIQSLSRATHQGV